MLSTTTLRKNKLLLLNDRTSCKSTRVNHIPSPLSTVVVDGSASEEPNVMQLCWTLPEMSSVTCTNASCLRRDGKEVGVITR